MTLLRGRVYEAILSPELGPKLYLVVSNNQRNRALGTALVARLTTSPKPQFPSIVELPPGEQFTGRVLCDDILELYEDEVTSNSGGLSPDTMRMVNDGLKAALALD